MSIVRGVPCQRRWPLRLGIAGLALVILVSLADGPVPLGAQGEPDEPAPSEPAASDQGPAIRRVLLEAERFVGDGWRPIAVGEGNYMVDAIGASHVSGGRLLHAEADAVGATARTELVVPAAG